MSIEYQTSRDGVNLADQMRDEMTEAGNSGVVQPITGEFEPTEEGDQNGLESE